MTLPNFVICGAPKAGTTSLYESLKQHPNVYMSSVKETDFFQHNYHKGMDWFQSFFQDYKGEKAIGEASPGNMIHLNAPERIARHIPDAKLIFILRNPIERAYSQYWYGIYRGDQNCLISFSDLIHDQNNFWGKRVIELGMYYEQICRFESFFNSSQLKIILYEELSNNYHQVLNDICNYLEIEAYQENLENNKSNQTYYPKNLILYKLIYGPWLAIEKKISPKLLIKTQKYRSLLRKFLYNQKRQTPPDMKQEDRQYLYELYKKSNDKLAKKLNVDLSHWK